MKLIRRISFLGALVVGRRRIVRFHFVLLLELRVFEMAKCRLELLDTNCKSLHHLIEVGEQLVLIGHSCLELDDSLVHGEIVTAPAQRYPDSKRSARRRTAEWPRPAARPPGPRS